jgi:hypothetical protein
MQDKSEKFDRGFLFVDNCNYTAYIPYDKIDSMHTENGEDGYISIVVVTVSGKEYTMDSQFNTFREALDFCEATLVEIQEYVKTCAI